MTDLWDDVIDFLEGHPWLQALAVLVAATALAKLLDWVVSGVLRRLAKRTESKFDDRLLELLHRPIFTTVVLVGLILATHRLDLDAQLERNTVLAIQTILVVVWVIFAYRFVRLLLHSMRLRPDRRGIVHPSTESLLSNAATVVFVVAGAYAILVIWDINVTGLVASAGIVGLALGFAAQDTLGNLFAGVAILSDRPYEVGDFIILDSGERGQVTKIGLRSTRILTRDDVEVSIPNGVMGAAKIINEAGGPPGRFRVRAAVGAAYGSDIDLVIGVLTEIAHGHPKVLSDPEPRVRLRRFGESSLDFELLCWIERPVDRGQVLHELNYAIYQRFAETGIVIPFPQRDVHLRGPGGPAAAPPSHPDEPAAP